MGFYGDQCVGMLYIFLDNILTLSKYSLILYIILCTLYIIYIFPINVF